MIKIKTQKGFIQIPLLILAIISILGVGSAGYAVKEYSNVSKSINKAENFTKEEKYDKAVQVLESAKNSWLSKNLGIKKQEITDKIEKNKKLFQDKSKYDQGMQEFDKQNYSVAKELFSEISDSYPHYQEAKNKMEEAQNKITEKQITEAVEKSKEEATKELENFNKPIYKQKPTPAPIVIDDPLVKVEKCKAEAKIEADQDVTDLFVSLSSNISSDSSFEQKMDMIKFDTDLAKGRWQSFYDTRYLTCLNK